MYHFVIFSRIFTTPHSRARLELDMRALPSAAPPMTASMARYSRAKSPCRMARTCRAPSCPRGSFALSRRASDDDDPLPAEDRTPTPQRRENPNIEGGKYGMGTRIDSALDASSNPNTFLAGALLATIGAVVLFVFGPSPPTEY